MLLALLNLPNAASATTLLWTNTGGGLWSAATNWSPNQVPVSADTVWITNAGSYAVTSSATVALAGLVLGDAGGGGTQTLVLTVGTLTVTNAASLTNGIVWLNGGSLVTAGPADFAGALNQSSGAWQLKSAATLGTYNLTNGELRGGTLTVTNFNWINGSLNADVNGDKTIIPVGGVLNLSGAATRHMSYYGTQGRGLDNYGTWNWSGDCILYGRNGGIVNNYGTVNVTGAGNAQYAYWNGDSAAPVWNNYGTFTKSGAIGIFYFNSVYLNNSSAITASSGTLSLYGAVVNSSGSLNSTGTKLQFYNATVTNTGPVSVGPGTLLTVDAGGTVVFAPESSLAVPTANAWQVNAGTVQLRTTNVTAPTVWVSGGTLWHQTNNTLPVVNQSAGTWRLSVNTTVSSYNLTNGELRGGTLTVTNFNWANGDLNADVNGDKTIIPAGGVLNLSGPGARHMSYYGTQGRGLDNYGTWNWLGDCVVYGRNGGVVNNYGTVNVLNSGTAQFAYWSGDAYAPTLNNFGTFAKSAGAGIFYLSTVYANNTGLVDLQTGRLSINNSVLTNSAAINLSAAAFLTFDAGNSSAFLPGSSLNSPAADHVIFNAPTVYLQTTNITTPSLWVAGGTVYQQTNNVVPTINQSGGTWRLALATTLSTYNLTNGELRGGTLTVTNFNWMSGDLNADANTDRTIIPAGGVLTLSSTATRHMSYWSPATKGRGLDNYGTWNWTGDCVLYGRNGGSVNNYGALNVLSSANAQFAYWNGDTYAPTLNNFGTFTKLPGTGIFYLSSVYANNTGLMDLQTGRLSINNAVLTNSAAINLSASAFLTFDAGNSSAFLPGSSLVSPAPDHVIFNAASVYLQTTNVTTPSFLIAGGTLWQQTPNVVPTINQSSGTWRLTLATTVNTYNLTNGALRGGTLTATNFTWIDGGLYADTNGDRLIIPATGTFNLLGAGEKSLSYYAPATKGYGVDNHGAWNWSGACVLRGFNSTVNNAGTVTIGIGAGMAYYGYYPGYLSPTWNNTGVFTKPTGAGTFQFYGAYLNNSGLLDAQAGTLSLYSGTTTNSASVTIGASALLQNDTSSETTFLPGSSLSAPAANSVRVNSGTVYLQTTNVATPALLIAGGTLYQQAQNVVSTINESSGVWRLALPTSVGTYNLTNGTLRGGTLTATNFTWTDGGLYADTNGDRLIIPATGTFNLLGAGEKSLSYYAPATKGYGVDNHGAWNWSGACVLRGFNSTVNNAGTVTIGIGAGMAYYGYYPGYLSPTWNNTGVFTKPAGAATFQFYGAYLNNSGLVDAQAGSLSLYAGTTTNSAAVTIGASALLQNDNSSETTFLPGSSLSAPAANSVRVNSGTVYLQTTNVTTPALLIAGGTLYQQAQNVVSTINESSGVWRLALATSVGTYNLTNGTLRGGTLTVTNFTWTDGALYAETNGDKLIIPATGTFNLLGAGEKSLFYYAPATKGYGIDNLGTWNWSGACMLRGFNSTVNNGGTVTVSASAGTTYYGYYPGYLAPTWNNTGVFSKPTGAGIFQFYGAYLNNSGLVDAQAGSLSLYAGTTTNSAAVAVGASALLQNDNSSETTFLPGSSLSASATNSVRVNSGTVYLQTTNVTTPALLIAGGTLYQQAPNVVSTINESAGVWRLALPTSVSTYNLTNGTLRGGTLTATNFNWTDGGLYAETNGDKLIIPATGTFNLLGAGEKSLFYYAPASKGYGIDNFGAWNWSGACVLRGFNSTVNNAGTVTVNPGAATASYSYYPGYLEPVWNNLGSFSKPSNSNTFNFASATVTNSGTLTSAGGTMRFGGNYVQTGGSASLGTNFIADAAVRVEAGSFTGRGFVAGQLYNADSLNPGASPGFITAASFTNTPSGTYNVELGGLSGGTNYDQLRVTGMASLTGLVQVAFVNGFTPVVGNSFTVMTYSARSGAFKDVQAPAGYTFQQVYTATNLILNAVAFSNVPPVITLQPSNRSVFAGTTVRFDVAATGTDPLNYQWKFGGNPIPGATNTSFILLSAQSTNQGNYAVDVSNLGGFAYSSNALLTVLPGFNFVPAFSLPISLPWNGASLQNSRVGYLAGPNGTVLATRNGGATWTSIGPGVPNTLNSVQVIDGAIFVFGSGGHICVSYDGGLTWHLYATGTTETFRSAYLTSLTTGWAVGSGGTIYQFGNNTWTPRPSGSGANFYGVWAYGGTAWAVGSGGSICRWNGAWTCGNYGSGTFYAVGFWPGGVNGLAVGSGGTIYRTGDGGNSWYPLASSTTADLYSVALTSSGGVDYAWIGGAGGTLLFSGNGGGGWSGLGSGTGAGITSVVFRDGYGLYCADDGSCRHFTFAPIGVNLPPAVALVIGTNLVTNATLRVSNIVCVPFHQSAVALDPDGVVTNLDFTVAAARTTNYFVPRTYPKHPDTYSFIWYNDVVGEFTIRAVAQDNHGAVAVSEPLTVAEVPADVHYLIIGGLLTNGACKLCMLGVTNNIYEVLANTNLLTTNWLAIGLMEHTNGLWRYSDAEATNHQQRFYRARQVP